MKKNFFIKPETEIDSILNGLNYLAKDTKMDVVKTNTDIINAKRKYKCRKCGYGLTTTFAKFEIVDKCPECGEKLRVRYKGIPVGTEVLTTEATNFDWDDDLLGIIEQESGMLEGLDFIRATNGSIVCLNEEATKFFRR